MKRFALLGAAIEGYDLLEMLVANMPKLCHVKLAAIELTSSSWEGIFEGLRFKRLQSLDLPRESDQLRHRNGEAYPKRQPGMERKEHLTYIIDFRRDIEKYVVHGGRHPSLPAGTPNRDAGEYLEEYFQLDHQCHDQQKTDRYKRAWNLPKDAQIGVNESSLVDLTRLPMAQTMLLSSV